MSYQIITNDMARQDFYAQLRQKGMDHRGAEMLALQQPPGARSDREQFMGIGTLDKQLGDDAEYICGEAQRRGYNPAVNDMYMESIADFPGDPKAFVKSRGDIQRRCEERGVPCRGLVNYTPPEKPPVHEEHNSLVDETVAVMAATDKNFAKVGIKEQRQEARRKHFRKKRTT